MSIFEHALNVLTSGQRNIKSPIFVKDFSKESQQLNDLMDLSSRVVNNEKKDFIDRDISYLKAGIEGENNVYFEIKNSFIPMLCLHDIRLEYGDYTAQYDFIIITNKFICILETKRLNGNIMINRDGDFIRIIKNKHGKTIKQEGMYSPISQNERHLNILKEILVNENLIKQMPIYSLVVMANPKTIIDKQKCPAYISKALYKYDQITPYLKKQLYDKKNDLDVLEKYMYRIADFLQANHKPIQYDYYAKYSLSEGDYANNVEKDTKRKELDKTIEVKESETIYKTDNSSRNANEQLSIALKEYRLQKSREEKVKPYFIYNNAEMEDLISKCPRTLEDLLNIKGFGKVKIEKYGEDIIKIINS